MGIVAIIGIIVVLLTNIEPLTIYSKTTETGTRVYYTYEQRNKYNGEWEPCWSTEYSGEYSEQQAFFTKDNMDTLREIKHTDVTTHSVTYQLKGFQIIKREHSN
mgnify:CR=1 FL=1